MRKKRFFTYIWLIGAVFLAKAEAGSGYITKIESYFIGNLIASPYDCSLDVKVVQSSKGQEFFIVITKPSGTVADDQIAVIPALEFIDLVRAIPELSMRPFPIADYFQRRYTYDNFSFSFGPFGRYSELQYSMTMDSRLKNSTVMFLNESSFQSVFEAAIKKVFELDSKTKQ